MTHAFIAWALVGLLVVGYLRLWCGPMPPDDSWVVLLVCTVLMVALWPFCVWKFIVLTPKNIHNNPNSYDVGV